MSPEKEARERGVGIAEIIEGEDQFGAAPLNQERNLALEVRERVT